MIHFCISLTPVQTNILQLIDGAGALPVVFTGGYLKLGLRAANHRLARPGAWIVEPGDFCENKKYD
jgi:hypothetical protein